MIQVHRHAGTETMKQNSQFGNTFYLNIFAGLQNFYGCKRHISAKKSFIPESQMLLTVVAEIF